MNFYCAEVAWMECLGGLKLPLEIAFASVQDPDVVFIVEMILPKNLYVTMQDMATTRSFLGNKDRYANHLRLRKDRLLPPTRIIKIHMNGWLNSIRDIAIYLLGEDFVLGVRCPSQMKFFKRLCGFNVKFVKQGPRMRDLWGCFHKHARLVRYLCPVTEARTMAVELKLKQLKYEDARWSCRR